jgi:polyhydroxyalkanoate synthesis regulator phasin
MSDRKGLISRISEMKQSAVDDFTQELFGNPRIAEMLGNAVSRAQKTKESFDRNLQFFLNTLNLPTRADYHELLEKIDSMNQGISDLDSRLDDLIAKAEKVAAKGKK